jgi:hypothetical protein
MWGEILDQRSRPPLFLSLDISTTGGREARAYGLMESLGAGNSLAAQVCRVTISLEQPGADIPRYGDAEAPRFPARRTVVRSSAIARGHQSAAYADAVYTPDGRCYSRVFQSGTQREYMLINAVPSKSNRKTCLVLRVALFSAGIAFFGAKAWLHRFYSLYPGVVPGTYLNEMCDAHGPLIARATRLPACPGPQRAIAKCMIHSSTRCETACRPAIRRFYEKEMPVLPE